MVHSVHLGLFGPIWPIQAYYINACISQSLSQTYTSSSLASLLHSCYYFLNCFNNKSLVFFLYSLSSLSPPHSTSQFLVSEKVFQAMSLSHGETPRTETPHYTTTPAYDEDENVTASTTLFSEDDRVIPHSTSQFLVSDKISKILCTINLKRYSSLMMVTINLKSCYSMPCVLAMGKPQGQKPPIIQLPLHLMKMKI